MNIVNYNYGSVLPPSSTHYRGKILVSRNEWRDIQIHLFKPPTMKRLGSHLGIAFTSNLLREDMQRTVKARKGFYVAIRVSATDEIVKAFNVFNKIHYKRQNYFFHVI